MIRRTGGLHGAAVLVPLPFLGRPILLEAGGGVLPNLANVASKLLFQLLGNFNDIVGAR